MIVFFLLKNGEHKVSYHVNEVRCTHYSHATEFHTEKFFLVSETIQRSAKDMLPIIQISSGFNIKVSINFVCL